MKKYILIIIISVICFKSYSQNQFSEYGNSTLISPSFVGFDKTKVSIKNRTQWHDLNTLAISAEHYLEDYRSGFGAAFIQQKEQSLVLNTFKLMYSYDFSITENIKIRPALEFSYFWNSMNFEKIYFHSQMNMDGTIKDDDLFYSDLNEKVHAFESSSSILIYSPKFWFNITINNMFSRNNSFQETNKSSRYPILFNYYMGYNILPQSDLNESNEALKVFALYKTSNSQNQLDLGAEWNNDLLIFGAKIRNSIANKISNKAFQTDAVIALVGLKFKGLDFYYSYDFIVSDLISTGAGANELTLNYRFNSKNKIVD